MAFLRSELTRKTCPRCGRRTGAQAARCRGCGHRYPEKASPRPAGLAIVGAGLVRVALSVPRRLIAGRVSLAVEYDLRNRLYAHLQSLELGFFDRQQVGQLMSRATVDLQSIRFFLGYGLVFIVQNLLTILLAAVAMVIVKPTLAAITLAPVPLVILAAARYGRYSRPALQEV